MENFLPILQQIFEICIIPLLGLLSTYLVVLIKSKSAALQKKIDNELASKYLGLLGETVANCVAATNQTYVNALKDKNAFTAEA
jgi:hypothetical protein